MSELFLPNQLEAASTVWNITSRHWQAKLRSDTGMGVGVTGCTSTRAVLLGNFLPSPCGFTHNIFHAFFYKQFCSQNILRKSQW